jgi:peptidoglycan-N-acetylglucosamine deacetylase
MYKKKRSQSSPSTGLLKTIGLGVAAIGIIAGILFGLSQVFGNQSLGSLANLGVASSVAANQKVLESIPIEFEVPKSYQAKTLKEVVLPSDQKLVTLTFDDGPWPKTTEEILDTLKKENVKATFYMIGQPLKSFPEIGKKVVAGGHEIANHTVHHWYHKMGDVVAKREIDDTNTIIKDYLNVKTNFFRPPGGVLNNGLADYAHKLNDAVFMWSVDSGDSQPRRPSVEKIVSNVMSQVKPGGIILMHDGGGNHENTAKAVPILIAKLRAEGYKMVTTTELLEAGVAAAATPTTPATGADASPAPTASASPQG